MTETKTGRLAMVTLDCADVPAMTAFYRDLLGWEVAAETDEYAMLTSGDGVALGFGKIADYQAPSWPDPGAKQFHLDLDTPDIDGLAARAVELGATKPDFQPDETWTVLLDPAGHPFCLANWNKSDQ